MNKKKLMKVLGMLFPAATAAAIMGAYWYPRQKRPDSEIKAAGIEPFAPDVSTKQEADAFISKLPSQSMVGRTTSYLMGRFDDALSFVGNKVKGVVEQSPSYFLEESVHFNASLDTTGACSSHALFSHPKPIARGCAITPCYEIYGYML